MQILDDRSASFIIRIWGEPDAGAERACQWRGSIEHIDSAQRRFFNDLAYIAEFIRACLPAQADDAPPSG